MATAPETLNRTYDVGGVLLERPFRVLRLGHFGFNVEDQEKALHFYSDLLGLPVTDTVDFGKQFNVTSPTGQDPNGYFLRVGADHHSVVLFPHWAFAATPAPKREGTTWISHMAWQVATLREVTEGRRWLTDRQVRIARPGGRDARGANWNFTVTDADAISNEIYYGMDQIGWDGVSKPVSICPAGDALPALEGAGEPDFPMARAAIEGGLDLRQGLHQRPFGEPKYDVAGIMLARPFRIVRNGPIRLFARDVGGGGGLLCRDHGPDRRPRRSSGTATARCSCAPTPSTTPSRFIRSRCAPSWGCRPDSICMAYGMQVGSYRQLRDAVSFLEKNGVTIKYLPPELFPGIDYSAFALDPEGHAIQLYYYMEQIGWDGRPRPAAARRTVDNAQWPEALDALSDTYRGPVFQGPLG